MSSNEIDDIVVNGHIGGEQEIELVDSEDSSVAQNTEEQMPNAEQEVDDIKHEEVLFDSLVEAVDTLSKEIVEPRTMEEDSSSDVQLQHNEEGNSTNIDTKLQLSDVDTDSEFFDEFMEIFDSELASIPKENVALSEPPSLMKQELLKFEEALDLKGKVEAVVFAAAKPIKSAEICDILQPLDESIRLKDIDKALTSIDREYKERAGGFRLVNLKGVGYQFQTCPAAAPIMERLFSSRPRPLSRAALETLSVIAYRQPVTRADIEFIRGVDAGSIIKNLLDRELIACVGRKEDSGRPMLFGTTKEFLKVFSLNTLSDLPPLAAFQPSAEVVGDALKKMNGEEEVDVEGFVGDETRDEPSIGDGVSEIDDSPIFNNDTESEHEADLRQGAISVVEEEITFDGESQDTEMVVSNGDNVEKTS